MNIQELQAQHPALYNEVFNLGKTDGVTSERDRVSAALVFNHLDPEGVKTIIASGKAMTATQQAEFALKAMSPQATQALATSAAPAVPTGQTDDTTKDKKNPELDGFSKNVRSSLGLKDKPNMEIGFESGVRRTA